jgi:hypothetical protein
MSKNFSNIIENEIIYQEHTDQNDVYVLFSVDLINEGSLKVYQAFTDLRSLTTKGLKENTYAIMKLKISKPTKSVLENRVSDFTSQEYPYGEQSICWTPDYLFFQNLFISNNLEQLIRLEKMIQNNENVYNHELVH